jgi:hypothetical protein
MRIHVALVIGLLMIASGCSTTTPTPAKPTASTMSRDWVLIAPPDNTASVAFMEVFEFLPDGRTKFPGKTDGLSEADRRSLKNLFEQVKAAPSAEASVEILTESASVTDAPLPQWRQVREFSSSDACESTRAELLQVTDEQTKKFGAYPHMPREEFQWPMLGRSFQWSRCVPRGLMPSSAQS